MKTAYLTVVFACVLTASLSAHEHAEVYLGPGNQLSIEGPASAYATYFPPGEIPSWNLPQFPGGAFACELTFSAFESTSPPPAGAAVRMEILSVSGPAGGSFSFWEQGAVVPTFTRPCGWVAGAEDRPGFFVSEDGSGYGHIHGRVFTTDRSGAYAVRFRAVDASGTYATSLTYEFVFEAIAPPKLSITMEGGNARITFSGRPGLVYDVQRSTTLAADEWEIAGDPIDGDGSLAEYVEPVAGRERVFYRIVEYP